MSSPTWLRVTELLLPTTVLYTVWWIALPLPVTVFLETASYSVPTNSDVAELPLMVMTFQLPVTTSEEEVTTLSLPFTVSLYVTLFSPPNCVGEYKAAFVPGRTTSVFRLPVTCAKQRVRARTKRLWT